jgi:hypothetical protein
MLPPQDVQTVTALMNRSFHINPVTDKDGIVISYGRIH